MLAAHYLALYYIATIQLELEKGGSGMEPQEPSTDKFRGWDKYLAM